MPPPKTPIEIILRPTGERIEPKKVECEVVLRKGQAPLLDGKPMDLAALRDAVNGMPVDVRTAVLRAEADEAFGRVMQIHDILSGALMQVKLAVLRPASAAKPGAPALALAVEADDRIRAADKTYTLEEFRAKAKTVLAGAERAIVTPGKEASLKTVAEVMDIIRQEGVAVGLARSASEAPPAKP
jgi:biopolymer transport protein ExbD